MERRVFASEPHRHPRPFDLECGSMQAPIRTAVIATAGFGTRFLPITKTVQKEMLPILTRPTIDYVVADCISAGIERIIFVVNEHNKQVLHFYRENVRLKAYLDRMGKSHLYEDVEKLHAQAEFVFVKQPESGEYGTAVPLKLVQAQLQHDEAFLVFMGDDFVFNVDGTSEAKRMIETFRGSRAQGLVTCITKPDAELFRYGVASVREQNGFRFLQNLVEKPAPGTAPSNLVNISKYIFTSAIFAIIAQQRPDAKSGELYITDSATTLASQLPVVIHQPQGEYLDCGHVAGWLRANLHLAHKNPGLWQAVKDAVAELET